MVSLAERIVRNDVKRQACWTERLVEGFVGKVKPLILLRRRPELVPAADAVWVLQEAVIPYGQKTGVKKASKAVN